MSVSGSPKSPKLTRRLSHENFAELAGRPSRSFKDLYGDKVREISRVVLDYIKLVTSSGGPLPGSGTVTGSGNGKISITQDPDGYPLVPRSDSLKKVSKGDLEKLYQSYMTMHYSRSNDPYRYTGHSLMFLIRTGLWTRTPAGPIQAHIRKTGELHCEKVFSSKCHV